ncbi:MAG: phosphoribosylpyrophosphate synthetase [Flavobacterium sp.]
MAHYNDMVEALRELKIRGYILDFSLRPDCLYCASKSLKLRPEDFTVEEAHRFEGADSSPDSNSVIYAISSNNTEDKGVLVDVYGAYAEEMTHEMAGKLNDSNINLLP